VVLEEGLGHVELLVSLAEYIKGKFTWISSYFSLIGGFHKICPMITIMH
jgi:hypothetical protein